MRKKRSEEERERGLSLSLSLSLSRAIHFLPFPLKFSISSEPASQVPARCATLDQTRRKNCPSVRRGKLKTMNVIREEIRANLCWLSLVIGQRSVVLCFTVTGCETIEATADTGRMLLPLPSNEKKSWQASKM